VPATIVRAARLHDFAGMVASWTRDGDSAFVPPCSSSRSTSATSPRPGSRWPRGERDNGLVEVAGPEKQDLVDMARRTLAARRESVRLTTGWGEPFGVEMAGEANLPGPGARIATTTFDDWLARQSG
jgi:hypothetical protein